MTTHDNILVRRYVLNSRDKIQLTHAERIIEDIKDLLRGRIDYIHINILKHSFYESESGSHEYIYHIESCSE